MKVVGVRQLKQGLSGCLDASQEEPVVVAKHGTPESVIIGVRGKDMEDVLWGTDENLLRSIAERRSRPRTVSHEEARKILGIPKRKRSRRNA